MLGSAERSSESHPFDHKKTGAQLTLSCAPAFQIFYLPKLVGYVNFSDPINPTTPGKE
jgi:hypothetical protein